MVELAELAEEEWPEEGEWSEEEESSEEEVVDRNIEVFEGRKVEENNGIQLDKRMGMVDDEGEIQE